MGRRPRTKWTPVSEVKAGTTFKTNTAPSAKVYIAQHDAEQLDNGNYHVKGMIQGKTSVVEIEADSNAKVILVAS